VLSRSRHAFVTLVCSICLGLAVDANADLDRPVAFDIPAGPLADALLELASQAGLSLVFSRNAGTTRHTDRLRGTLTPRAALARLIGDACLAVVDITPTLIAVREGCAHRTTPARAPVPTGIAMETAVPPGVEEIIVRERYVTGSRIRLTGTEPAAHVEIIDRSGIELAGNQDIGELLRTLPAVAGNSTSTLVTNGGDGTANITLRGLPASNTLVLLNGRRVNADPWTGRSVDLNTIPLGLVDRIEVFKDGASALYGSDAIAGVVNIVTQGEVQGLALTTYYGGSSRADLDTVNASIVYGGAIADFRYVLGASYYEQDAIYSRDRALSRSSDDRARGGSDKRSSATAPGRFIVGGTPVILANWADDGSDPAEFRPATADDLFEYRDFTTSVVPSDRASVFADVRQPLAIGELYAEALITHTRSENTLAPTPLLTAFELQALTIAADAAFNPFDIAIDDARRRLIELGPRTHANESDTSRIVVGVDGAFDSLHWDASYGYHVTEADEHRTGLVWATGVARAIGPAGDCVAPCLPLDLFGPPGSITPAMLDYLAIVTDSTGRSTLQHASFDLDVPLTSLPTGDVEVAAGLEYRRESLRIEPDELIATADTLGGNNDSRFAGSRHLWEMFGEVWVPVARDLPYVHRLDAQLAVRWSEYSDFGTTTNPRVALHYRPAPAWMVRLAYTRGFRAPTLRQLHAGQSQSFEFLNDPCALADNVGVMPGCVVQSDPTLVQFMTVRSGNVNLEPERAQTYTLGLVYSPGEMSNLRTSIDLFHIIDKDVVDASAQFLINENAESLRFADQVVRDPRGNIQRIDAPFQNIGRREVTGLDFEADYMFATGSTGSVHLAARATHIREFEEKFDPSSQTVDYAGTFRDEASAGNGALPDWKINLSAIWQNQFWSVGYHTRFVSALKEVVPVVERRRTIDHWRVDRLQVSYLGPASWWTKLTIGVNNIWDEEPPFAAAAFNDSYDSRTYDITGRYLYLQAQRTF